MCIGLLFGKETGVHIEELFENPLDNVYLLNKCRWIGRSDPLRKIEMIKVLRKEDGNLTIGICSGASKGGFLIGMNEKGLAAAGIASNGLLVDKLSYFIRDVLANSNNSNDLLKNGKSAIKNGYFPDKYGGIILSMDKSGMGACIEASGYDYYGELVSGADVYSNCFKYLENRFDTKYPMMRIRRMKKVLDGYTFQSLNNVITHHGNVKLCRHEEDNWNMFTRSICTAYFSEDNIGLIYNDGPACRSEPKVLEFGYLKDLANGNEDACIDMKTVIK